MSEQTPETDNSVADGQDPSMEDILASIRKIIAEDDVQVPATPETVTADIAPDAPSPSGDVSELGHVETLDLDIITEESTALDPDIEALIGDMDAMPTDKIGQMTAAATSPATDSPDDILDLEIPMDETEVLAELDTSELEIPRVVVSETPVQIERAESEALTLDDELIDLVSDHEEAVLSEGVEDKPATGLVGGAMAALGLGGVAAAAAKDKAEPEVEAHQEDNLSRMLDNMLEDSKSYEDAPTDMDQERVIDPAEDLIAQDESDEDILTEIDFIDDTPETSEVISENDPDMDLVKSLMADLTETPQDEEADTKLDNTVSDVTDDLEPSSDGILDEILSVTLDDETQLTEEIEPVVEGPAGESLSLKEIAAAAEAEAQASESGVSPAVLAGVAAVATGGVAAIAGQDDTPDMESADDDVDDTDTILTELDDILAVENSAEPPEDLTPEAPEPETPEPLIEETPDMARAKKSDAIIDEVTETATADVFASLNQVVEEKAVVAERGDRIGDLVQEALRPMLKEWLDANLKGIVQRAVTKEVKRISSGK